MRTQLISRTLPAPFRRALRRAWLWLTVVALRSDAPGRRQQAALLAGLLVVLIPLGALLAVTPPLVLDNPDAPFLSYAISFAALLLLGAAFWLNRAGHYAAAVWITLGVMTVTTFALSLTMTSQLLIFLAVPVLLASVLLSNRATTFSSSVLLAGLLLVALLQAGDSWVQLAVQYLLLLTALILVVSAFRGRIEAARQRQLSESEAYFRRIFEKAPLGMAVITGPERRLLRVNDTLRRMLGYSADELTGLTLSDITHTEDTESAAQFIQAMTSTIAPYAEFEQRYRTRDGRLRWGMVTFSFIRDTSAGAIQGLVMIRDISERKEAEAAAAQVTQQLEQANRELLGLHSVSQRMATSLDLREIYRLMHTYVTERFATTTHLLIGLYDEAAQVIRCNFAVIDEQEMDTAQFPPLPLSGGPMSETLGSREPRIVDVQELERKLADQPGRFNVIGDERVPCTALYLPLIAKDRAIGVMSLQSYDSRAFKTADFPPLMIIASQAAAAIENARLFAQVQQHADYLEQRVTARTAELQAALANEKELSELKSRFASMVSHEFRNPLAAIQTSSDLLRLYTHRLTSEQRVNHHDNIQRQVRHLASLLDDILLISKAESVGMEFQPEPLELVSFCQGILDEIRLAGYTRHDIQLSDGQEPFQGDPKLLRYIVTNLLTNAVKYSLTGGMVRFEICGEGDAVTLKVQDTGIGIPVEDQPRLFEAFHRGRNVGGISGTGLGLAITRLAVEAHGGSISFVSRVGAGTTFIVTLPRHHGPARSSGGT